MYLQDAFAALDVGHVHDDLTVEAAGTQQRRVQNVGTVRSGDEHDGIVGIETIHLDEQLVEGLLAFVMAAAQAGATLTADCVDLVDEDDRRRSFLGLLEQVANTRCADADEHLDEVGTGDAEERHARFAGHRTREQRLASARRADEQASARDLRAKGLVFRRVGEEVLDFLHLLDSLIYAGDVVELYVRTLLMGFLGLRLAEAHLLVVGLLHLREEDPDENTEQKEREDRAQDVEPLHGQRHLVGDLGMLRYELGKRLLADIGRCVTMLLSERRRAQAAGAEACEGTIGPRLEHGKFRVQGAESFVERIGSRLTCGDCGIVRTSDGVVASVVHDRHDAVLLDGLQEL